MDGLGLSVRTEVLRNALAVEGMTSIFLAKLIGIDDITKSRVLGNKGGGLSFNQRVDMLIEIGALSASDRNKFQAFMEIRNQFMHNLEASSYEKCFLYTGGTDKFLLKTYPQEDTLTREAQLRAASNALGNEVVKLTAALIQKSEDKIRRDVEFEMSKLSQQAFFNAIEEMKKSLDDFFNKEIKKGEKFNVKRLKGFGTQLSQIIYRLWKKHFAELSKIESAITGQK